MTVHPQVSIVIPNWNGLAHLPECLESLRGQSFSDHEVLVVDNGSSDGSVRWLRENADDVLVIERGDNGGFAVAVNEGIRAARGDAIVLLNNDTVADPGWLEALVRPVLNGVCDFSASLMVFYDMPEMVNAAGDVFNMITLSGRNRGIRRPASEYRDTQWVLNASAGAAAYHRSFFDDVGLFDEDFFLLSEDTDLGLRALIADKHCLFVADAVIRHKASASINTLPSWAVWIMAARNEAHVVGKDFPAALLPYAVLMWPIRILRALPIRPSRWRLAPGIVTHMPERLVAEVQGFVAGLRKRKDVWSRRRRPTWSILRWFFVGTARYEAIDLDDC